MQNGVRVRANFKSTTFGGIHASGEIRAVFVDLALDQSRRTERIEERDSSEHPLPTRLSVGGHVKLRRLDATTGLIEEILAFLA